MSAPADPPVDAALKLALAMIASSYEPLVMLNGELAVVAASASFCRTFQVNSAVAAGRPFFDLGDGEWNIRQLRSLLGAIVAGSTDIETYDFDLKRGAEPIRHLVLNAHKLDYGDPQNVRILLGISDVTDARQIERLKDDLLHEKAVLLQEMQHRIANSLQIIASVLLQSARKVQSDETRDQLKLAHHRIVSVAAVQRHLTSSHLEGVALRPYFTQLCESLAASMIQDASRLSLSVQADDSIASGDISVSLGLIVTELVINALKHAFPDQRPGRILVSYAAAGGDWTLGVTDNGVGMPDEPAQAKAGLGTSIVEALARQLDATISIGDAGPGTTVSITHRHVSSDAANLNQDPAERGPRAL